MKSINKKIIVTLLVIIEIMLINVTYKSYSNRIIDEKEIENKRIAIKVDNGNNGYEDREEFPGRGYVLNTELTECLDIEGNKLNKSDIKSDGESVTLTGKYTSYCTLYFYLIEDREYNYTGDYQVFIAPKTGEYKIELWGASGGSTETGAIGGNGAYTKGIISLKENEKIYIFVGEEGHTYTARIPYILSETFNGGGRGQQHTYTNASSGGGATDIRLNISETGNWNDFNSLKSRIMVAAGGGGGHYWSNVGNVTGGYGGTLVGGEGIMRYISIENDNRVLNNTTGGTQTSGGEPNDRKATGGYGKFGIGGNSASASSGGGGGYYGGGGGIDQGYSPSAGAGGSSYISGYIGCIAIDNTSTENSVFSKTGCDVNAPDLECSKHYSGKYFTDPQMIAGNSQMPTHNGEGTMEGNIGNGHAKITFVK